MSNKQWNVLPKVPEETLNLFPELPPLLVQLLWNRGITTQEQIDEFLDPDWSKNVHDPYLFRDMRKSVEAVYEAIGRGEVIGIFGDYDADGVTASTILATSFEKLGAKVEVYLPHREREGYGLNNDAISFLKHKNVSLLVTCDCGIANVDQVAFANSQGLKVIITDHHQAGPILPSAFAILHPSIAGETYPGKNLSGGGVAFKFVQGLLRYDGCHLSEVEREAHEKWLLDLVAISSIADMVPLQGETRTLTKFGLTVLTKTRRSGLRKLIEVAGLRFENMDSYAVGFQLAPRLNAAGRLDHARAAYALLMARDEAQATELARSLNLVNSERQRITDELFLEAKLQVGELNENTYLVHAYAPEWSIGMVGLVAAKLCSAYNRPTIVMGNKGSEVAGSARGDIGGFDFAKALSECSEYLSAFGGHKGAAGFTVRSGKLEQFVKKLAEVVQRELSGKNITPELKLDAVLELPQVDWDLYAQIERLEPVGQANPGAVFVSYGLTVVSADRVGGQGQHLRLALQGGTVTRKFIGFRFGDLQPTLNPGSIVDVAYEVSVNEWNGNRELQCSIIDIVKRT